MLNSRHLGCVIDGVWFFCFEQKNVFLMDLMSCERAIWNLKSFRLFLQNIIRDDDRIWKRREQYESCSVKSAQLAFVS
jgi:hypothetical protein